MTKHAPEPWVIDEDDRPGMDWNRHIYSADGMAVCFMSHSDGKDPDKDEATCRRIVACVNACEGIPTEILEFDKSALLEALKQREMLLLDKDRLDWMEKNPRLAEIHVNGRVEDCFYYAVAGASGVRLLREQQRRAA